MQAVVVIRGGELPAGSDETIAECGGRALLIGSDTHMAATALVGVATDVQVVEAGAFHPGTWADALVPLLAHEAVIVLPGSPDGRDLAPRLAVALGRTLFAQATRVSADRVELSRMAGTELHQVHPPAEFVATLQTGVRGAERMLTTPPHITVVDVALPEVRDATVLDVLPPDAATVDLTEAPRILGGGAGLDAAERFDQLSQLGVALGASVGARDLPPAGWRAGTLA